MKRGTFSRIQSLWMSHYYDAGDHSITATVQDTVVCEAIPQRSASAYRRTCCERLGSPIDRKYKDQRKGEQNADRVSSKDVRGVLNYAFERS